MAARSIINRPSAMPNFPGDRGTYTLILWLAAPAHLTIGQLGSFDFPAGWYAYVGSAFGAGGLRGRLKHHLTPVSKPHWHIDYLRAVAPLREIWWLATETRYEHTWADALRALPGAVVPAPRFGASDCRCPSHLISFNDAPDSHTLAETSGMRLQRQVFD